MGYSSLQRKVNNEFSSTNNDLYKNDYLIKNTG